MGQEDGDVTIALAVLDFDGVIADSLHAHLDAYKRVFEHFGKQSPFLTPDLWKARYCSRWERNFLDNGFAPDEFEHAKSIYSQFVDYRSIALFPGIGETLGVLAETVPLAILSTTPQEAIKEFLEYRGILNHFSFISGSSSKSGKEDRLRAIIEHFNVAPHHAVMVGDTAADIEAAHAVGARAVAVTYGWYALDRLHAANPHHVVDSPFELLSVAR